MLRGAVRCARGVAAGSVGAAAVGLGIMGQRNPCSCTPSPSPLPEDRTAEWHRQQLEQTTGVMKIGRLSDPSIDHVLLTENQISRKVTELAGRMAADYKRIGADRVTLVCVLKGSFIYTADLARALSHAGLETELEFISVSSYGDRKSSSGTVRLELDCRHDVAGKHVLIVEDICDSGHTLIKLVNMFKVRNPASLHTTVLINKGANRSAEFASHGIDIEYIGFEIPNKFVGGYGLDFAERFRELADIVVLAP